MIALYLVLAAGSAPPAVQAERDFAAMAQVKGQWTAFRAYAAPDAVMFVPQPVNAQDWLKDRKDPPQSVAWWPGETYVSCDGTSAVNSGPWLRDGGRLKGYFTTVWRKQADGSWKWLLDHGDALEQPRAAHETPKVERASCLTRPIRLTDPASRGYRTGSSPDGSLVWNWRVYEDGARIFWAELWDGRAYRKVVEDKIEARAR